MTDQFRRYLAELIGTFILVFMGGLGILSSGGNIVVIAFAFGLGLLVALYAVGEISGGHFNPAVSVAALLDGRINVSDYIGYLVSQVGGAVLAALLLAVASSRDLVGTMVTQPPQSVGAGSAFLIELALTAMFVMVILKVTASGELSRNAFGAISFALVGIHMAAVPLTGASVNPARSFGPAIVGSNTVDLWIYLVAPLVGAVVGWVIYQVTTKGTIELNVDNSG